MTKVEELRDRIVGMAHGVPANDMGMFMRLLADYHASGVAEGVAAERERIRDIVCPDEDEHGDLTIGWLSLSVLAPTKEKP